MTQPVDQPAGATDPPGEPNDRDTAAGDPSALPAGNTSFQGVCYGGPLDGQRRISRCPSGLLAADKAASRAWLYDWRDDGFHVREPEGRQLDGDRAIQAAIGDQYDVVAVSGVADDGSA